MHRKRSDQLLPHHRGDPAGERHSTLAGKCHDIMGGRRARRGYRGHCKNAHKQNRRRH